MSTQDLDQICRGLSKNRNTLSHLSLRHCCFGDEGAELICRHVKNHPSLTHLDLTGDMIGRSGAHEAANMLQHQALHRHSSAWEESLRYRSVRMLCYFVKNSRSSFPISFINFYFAIYHINSNFNEMCSHLT